MSRTKKLLHNSFAAAICSIATVISGMILPRLIITTYGSSINGLTVSISQFVSYLHYLEAGLSTSFIFALYKPLADNDKTGINDLVTQAKHAYKWTSFMYLIGVIVISFLYPVIIQRGSVDYITASILTIVIGLSGVLEMYTLAKYRVLLVSDQKSYIIYYMSLVTLLVNLGLSVLLISFKADIISVKLIPLVSFVVRSAILNIYIKKNYPFIDYKGKTKTTSVLNKRFDAMLMEIIKTINLSFPVVAISIFCSLQLVSIYSVYNLVFSGLTVLNVVTNGASASFGNIIAKGEHSILQKANEEYEVLVFTVVTFLYACTLILIIPFVKVYVSGISDSGAYVDYTYGFMFVIWGFLFNARLPHTQLINGGGLFEQARKTNISQIILLVILLCVLVPAYQIKGALIAMIISTLYYTVSVIVIVKKEVIKNSIWITMFRIIRGFIIMAVCYIPFYYIKLEPKSILEWFYNAVPVAIWCLFVVVCFNFIFERTFFVAVLKRLGNLVHKRT